MKVVLYGLLGVLVVVVGVVGYVYVFAGDIIKQVVETYGSEATQAEVTLNNVDLDMTQGTGALTGLTVGNPSGFSTPSAFELGQISMQIDTNSLQTDTIVIRSIAVRGPVVTYEKAGGSSNIEAIQQNVDAYAKQFTGGGGGSSSSSSEGGAEKKVIIEQLVITGGQVKLSADLPGMSGKTLDASLPEIRLTDIGKDDGGANPADVIKSIIDEMTSGIASINPEGLIKNAAGAIGDAAKGAADAATKAVEGVSSGAGDAVKGVTEGASGAVEGATQGLKNLLGN